METLPLENILELPSCKILHPDELEGSEDPEAQALLALQQDLQGNILKSHGRNFSVQFFLKFKSEKIDIAKLWISNFAKQFVTSGTKQRQMRQSYQKRIINRLKSQSLEIVETNISRERALLEPDEEANGDTLFTNLFLSFEGYKTLLQCRSEKLKEYFKDSPFIFGMKNENGRVSIGDPPLSQWEEGFAQEIHALILLAHSDCDSLSALARQIESETQEFADIVHREVGKVFRDKNGNAIEHFGFVDGISQPLFFKDDIDRIQQKEGTDLWNPSAPLKLVLVKDPLSPNLYSCGSYFVYRKLQQHVDKFQKKIQELVSELEVERSLAEAFVMGRFKDGTPVTLFKSTDSQHSRTNNFNYQGDIHGTRCPFHAHIRKTNPRGEKVTTNDNNQKDRRIARRGMSYSYQNPKSPLDIQAQLDYLKQASIDTNPGAGEVGLLFMCFQGSITNQFVTIQKTWANNMHFPKNYTGTDPVIGQDKQLEGGQYWSKGKEGWDENHKGRYDFSNCVQMKGGEYFFTPSISFLINLPKSVFPSPSDGQSSTETTQS